MILIVIIISIKYLEQNGINVDDSILLLGDLDTYNETVTGFVEEILAKVSRLKMLSIMMI